MSGQSLWKRNQADVARLRELHQEFVALGSEIQGILSRLGVREYRGEILSAQIGDAVQSYNEILPLVDDLVGLSGQNRERVERYTRAQYTGPVSQR